MKIFTTQDIRTIQRQTIEHDQTDALELSIKAAAAIAPEITARWTAKRPVMIFAGPGGNGADALALAIRLHDMGYSCETYLFNISGNRLSPETRRLRDELRSLVGDKLYEVTGAFNLPEITRNHVVVDGLFGTGLTEPLKGGFTVLVGYINESGAPVVSIDLPSGMFGDWNKGTLNRNVVHATLTIALQFPRLAFLLKENAELVGEWVVADVGLNASVIRNTKTNYQLLDPPGMRRLLKPRDPFASKADYGSALLIAGSHGMMGAAVLATQGALRAGAGKVTLHGPGWGCDIAQTSVPEAMYDSDPNDTLVTSMKPQLPYTAIGVGPGLGTAQPTVSALDLLLKSAGTPLVLDADALNCIAAQRSMLNLLPPLSILTPHAAEYDRLFGACSTDEERILSAVKQAETYQILILLKGRYTALVRPDGKVYFNSTGTPALATPGSGDVLTGLICGFLAQGYRPEIAPLLGAYIHGLAGELAEATIGQYSVTATDILNHIGPAIRETME